MIPNWITVALMILWIIWAYIEVTGYIIYRRHNSSNLSVRLYGKAYYTRLSLSISVLFIVLTAFGFSYYFVGD